MLVLITYDVNTTTKQGRKRLSKIAKTCCNYGQRVQNSVFECDVDPAQLAMMKNELMRIKIACGSIISVVTILDVLSIMGQR